MQFITLLTVSCVLALAVPPVAPIGTLIDPNTQVPAPVHHGVVTGFASGLFHGAESLASGVANTIFHPIQTVKGLGHAIAHPIKTVRTAKDDFKAECQNKGGAECAGKATFEVAALALGPTSFGAAGAKVGEIAGVAGAKVGGITSKAGSAFGNGIGSLQQSAITGKVVSGAVQASDKVKGLFAPKAGAVQAGGDLAAEGDAITGAAKVGGIRGAVSNGVGSVKSLFTAKAGVAGAGDELLAEGRAANLAEKAQLKADKQAAALAVKEEKAAAAAATKEEKATAKAALQEQKALDKQAKIDAQLAAGKVPFKASDVVRPIQGLAVAGTVAEAGFRGQDQNTT